VECYVVSGLFPAILTPCVEQSCSQEEQVEQLQRAVQQVVRREGQLRDPEEAQGQI
jgi:hypothetical protein